MIVPGWWWFSPAGHWFHGCHVQPWHDPPWMSWWTDAWTRLMVTSKRFLRKGWCGGDYLEWWWQWLWLRKFIGLTRKRHDVGAPFQGKIRDEWCCWCEWSGYEYQTTLSSEMGSLRAGIYTTFIKIAESIVDNSTTLLVAIWLNQARRKQAI